MAQIKDPLLKDPESQQPSRESVGLFEDAGDGNEGEPRSLLDGWWPLIAAYCVLAIEGPFKAMMTGAVVSALCLLKACKHAQDARSSGGVIVFPKSLDVGQLVIYLVLTSILVTWPALGPIITEWLDAILNFAYALMFLPGLLCGQPLALEYGKEDIPAWVQRRSQFLRDMYFYTWLWFGLLLAMAAIAVAPGIYHTISGNYMYWPYARALEVAQYVLMIYGITKPRRDTRRQVLQWGFGMADQLPAKRLRHQPKRLVDASGKVLSWVVGSGRLYPRPYVIYRKPESSQSDIMPNLQIMSAPSLQKSGVPLGPWDMRYKAFFELDDRPRKCAMLIDDVQMAYRKFFDEDYLRAQVSVLEAARAGGIPVFWSYWDRKCPDDGNYCTYDEFYGPYGVTEFKGMNATYLTNPSCAALMEEVLPRTEEEQQRVIKSIHMDCFANVDYLGQSILKSSLDALGVDTLILTGCWTDACIIATCIRAVTEDFNVILPEDAVFSCTSAAASAVDVMRNLYAKVAPADEVSMYLRSSTSD
jgi:nicotinamidase-related amidase